MANYKIVNPSAGNVYFDAAGSAASATAENTGSGAIAGLGADQVHGSNKKHGIDNLIAGNIVISGVGPNNETTAANPAGIFALNAAASGSYIIRRVTTTIAGVASQNTLRSGGSHFGDEKHSIHKVESSMRHTAVATAIRDGNWNVFSGVYSPAADATNTSIGDSSGNTVTNGSADHEANASRTNQGEFTYMASAAIPATGQYSAKLG